MTENRQSGIIAPSYKVITSNVELQEYCRRWQSKQFLALDTEFMRVSSFYPELALIQVSDGDEIILLDPLGINDWSAFVALLLAPDIVKVLHSCSEDLQVFLIALGCLPSPLFDTQLANALLGGGHALSYQNLVREKTGIELPKGETRSDWLQRPLSPQQLDYAALDVAYLPAIYLEQSGALAAQQRLSWLEEECARMLEQNKSEVNQDFSSAYLNIKGAWPLSRVQLSVLRALAEWREQRARQRNKPRSWIIDDKSLLLLARDMPADMHELRAIDLPPAFIRHEGEAVLARIASAASEEGRELPELQPRPMSKTEKKALRQAQLVVAAVAEQEGLPAELLASKRLLLAFYYACERARAANSGTFDRQQLILPAELDGWRRDLLLEALLECFGG